jgi:hypothetical protein
MHINDVVQLLGISVISKLDYNTVKVEFDFGEVWMRLLTYDGTAMLPDLIFYWSEPPNNVIYNTKNFIDFIGNITSTADLQERYEHRIKPSLAEKFFACVFSA